MSNPYDVHSWSALYRQEALEEANRRHLAELARAGRQTNSEPRRPLLVWTAAARR